MIVPGAFTPDQAIEGGHEATVQRVTDFFQGQPGGPTDSPSSGTNWLLWLGLGLGGIVVLKVARVL